MKPHILYIAPPKDITVFMDALTLVEDGTPLWRDD
jgi:hypothetical protein